MTDRERYLRAFSALQPSDDWMDQLEAAEPKKVKHHGRRLIAALAAAILIVGLIGAAYAADLGGIQGRVKLWHLGKLTNMTVEPGWFENDGNPMPVYFFYDEDGEVIFANPTSVFEGMTIDEIADEVSHRVMVYENRLCDPPILKIHYYDQTIDITEYFDENGDGWYEGEISGDGRRFWVTVWRYEGEDYYHQSVRELE